MNICKESRFLDHNGNYSGGEEMIKKSLNNKIGIERDKAKLLLILLFFGYGGGCTGFDNKKIEYDESGNKIKVDINDENDVKFDSKAYNIEVEESESRTAEKNNGEKSFGGVELSYNGEYEVPGISKSAKRMKHKDFPKVQFGDCRLTKQLGSVVYSNAIVAPEGKPERREAHKETFYSQKKLHGGGLNIPGKHVAKDGTIRDEHGYIIVAAPLSIYPRGTRIMTTLGPGKVYDTGGMRGRWIDIYVNW